MRDQFFVLQLEHEQAVDALATMVPEANARRKLLQHVQAIVSAGDPPSAAEHERMARLSQVLTAPMEQATVSAISSRPSATRPNARTDTVVH